MDLRKVTRNPGWWRLFIVLAGLWYGGWLVGGVVMFSEEIFNREPVGGDDHKVLSAQQGVAIPEAKAKAYPDHYSERALSDGLIMADAAGDTEAAKALANMIVMKRAGTRPDKLPAGFILDSDLMVLKEYVNPFADLIPPPAPWYMDRRSTNVHGCYRFVSLARVFQFALDAICHRGFHTGARVIVDNPVSLKSYPRINGLALSGNPRINGLAFTHKRSCISYSTYRNTCSSQAPHGHNSSELHPAPPVFLPDCNASRNTNQERF